MYQIPAAIALLLPLSGLAETIQLDDVLVTASRHDESSQQALYSSVVLSRDQIQAMQAQDVVELLQQIPGVQIGRNGGPGQASSLFMRGAASDHTLVLLDGVPLQSGSTGATALQHLMPEPIQRIEVVKGPASALYGSSAIGGVIQLFTRPAQPGNQFSLNAGLGSDDTQHASASLGHQQDGVHASFSLGRRSSNGYPPRTGSTMDRGYRNNTLRGALGIDFANSAFEISHFETGGKVEYLDSALNPVDQDTQNRVSRLVYDQVFSDHWDSRLLISRTLDKVTENQSADYADTLRDSLDWQHNISLNEYHTLVTGISFSHQQVDLLSFGTHFDESDQTTEAYLHDTWQGQNTRIQGALRLTEHDRHGRHATWSAAVGHQLHPAIHLHANAGTAFRVPSANDLYGYGGNPAFNPETAISGELGVRYRFAPEANINLTGYYTEIDDLIESDPVTYTIQQVESARIQGIELDYQQRMNRWHWSFGYVYQDALNQDQQTDLPRRAQNKIHGTLRYQTARASLALNTTYASERKDSRFSDISLAPYTLWDINMAYQLNQSVALQGKVQNLLDENYELASGYPAQGRFVGLELRYTR